MAYRGSEAYDFSLFEPQVIEQPKKQQPRKVSNTRTAVKSPAKKPVNKSKKAPPKATATAPARTAVKKPVAPKTAPVKKNVIDLVESHRVEIDREVQTATVPDSVKKALCFAMVCVSLVVVLLVMQTKNDTLISEISAMESQIDIAEGENVRLNAELSSKISTDKIENYAENVLGMVKAESYQISYIDLSEGDEILVSGDKTLSDKSALSGKIKELFAYIF